MRITIDFTCAVNQSAGIGRFVRSLVFALSELDHENDYQLLYAAPNEGATPRFPEADNFGRRQMRFSQRTLDILWHRLRLPISTDLFSGCSDIFHSPDFVLPPVRGARSLLTVHDLAFLLFPDCADASLRAYLEQVVPRSVARADFIAADSENTRNDLICLLGARPERVAVVPGGVDPFFHPVEDEARLAAARRQLGLDDRPFILFVGVLEPRKNLTTLFDAYRQLRDRCKIPHRLVVVGKRGWLVEDILSHAEQSPYRDDIVFSGFVPDADLPALYSTATVFAFPSLYEGFGLPPLEAMACGTPVVVSRTSSLPEVVGDAGLQVDPENVDELAAALELAVLDDKLRVEMRRKGLARAATFTWPAAARQLLNVYGQVARA
ncbi:MAG: glycosyltransferase family 4 protein [Chloroflexi bacterium]|nr:glycosyltransferase family 4 protein [Chloroflexota bacterium]